MYKREDSLFAQQVIKTHKPALENLKNVIFNHMILVALIGVTLIISTCSLSSIRAKVKYIFIIILPYVPWTTIQA